MIYEFRDLWKYQKVSIVSRQISDFNIVCAREHPSNANVFMTAGKENIRYWKLKRNLLTSSSVVLNQ